MPNAPHVFHLGAIAPQISGEVGSRAAATRENFPLLRGLSLSRLRLAPLGVREPHWHPNAHELTYCLRGRVLVTIFSNGSLHDTFQVSAGEMFFVPSGALHHLENVGDDEAEFLVAFSHDRPEDFGLTGFCGAMSDNVLGNTFQLPGSAFSALARKPVDRWFGRRDRPAEVPAAAQFPNRFKYAVDATPPQLTNVHGAARMAKKTIWPVLEDLAMFSLTLADSGMREPHWHPRTAEMGYVVKGHARMAILSPGGDVDTYELRDGDMYFIPKAYPHHIENLGGDDMHFAIFFDNPVPEDIGLSGAMPAYSREALGASFGCPPEFFAALPSYPADLLVVNRRNPVEP